MILDNGYYSKHDIHFIYYKKMNIDQDLLEEKKILFISAISYKLGFHTL